MQTQPKASIVRIFATRGDIVGMGFLASERSILSCAHVITAALGIAEDTPDVPTTAISLDFPLIAPGYYLTAHVSFWQPPQPNGSGDIAILQLDEPIPTGAEAAHLVSAEDLWNRAFRAFGFPGGHDAGVWAPGTLRDRQATGWVQIEQTSSTGYRVQQGFSGGPVWDEELDGVVGMVVAEERDPTIRAAYMISTDVLVKAWPPLEQQARPPSPYRGLFAFQEQDASVFFGRETFTDQLVEAVQRQSSFAIVLGPSGSGKSSVVFAGLFPRLRKESTWLLAHLRPGNAPFQALATALLLLLEQEMTETDRLIENRKLATALSTGDLGITEVVDRIVEKHQGSNRVLLAIDQFEELYTLCPDQAIRQQFLDVLVKAVEAQRSQQHSRMTVVLTLRADFLGQALAQRSLADVLQDAALMLTPMTHMELKTAIEEPARQIGVTFAPGLIERIVDDVEYESGQLPLLEFALTLLWERQEKRRLTHEAYEEIGRVEGALARYADQVYDALGEDEKERVRRVSVQMVRPGEHTEDTRRLATRGELGEEGWILARRLSDKRLVVTDVTPNGQETAEIVHEALIQRWTRLQAWMNADRTFREWQERLRSALHQWEENKQDEGALLHGALLTEATYWLEKRGQELTSKERDYVFYSILNEGISIPTWLPRYGTIEETFAFLDTYLNAPEETRRLKSIEALKCLPRTDPDDKVYEQLQRFVLADASIAVRNKAAYAICERGQITRLTGLLASKGLSIQERQRVIQALASTRNLPGTGLEVKKALKQSRLRILFWATMQLLLDYRNAFAIIVFFSFLLGQLGSYLADQVSSVVESSSNLQQVLLPISVFQVIMILVLGLYVFIRRGIIDGKSIGIKECIGIGAIVAIIVDSINFAPQIIAAVRDTHEPVVTAISLLLLPHFLIDTAIMSIIALSVRVHLRNRSAAWILFLIAILSAAIAALSQQVIAIHITEINQTVSHLPATNILQSYFLIILNDIYLNHYYASSISTNTIFIAWFLGFCAVFGCLLGYLIGFRSAFSSKQASVTSSLPTASLGVVGTSSRSIRIFSRRTAIIVFSGLAVIVVCANLLWWVFLHHPYTYQSNSSPVGSITWSPDGKYLAYTTYSVHDQNHYPSTLRVLDFANDANLSIYNKSSSYVGSITWSPDGKYLAFTYTTDSLPSSLKVGVWDASTHIKWPVYTNTYPLYEDDIFHAKITWSPDGKYLAYTTSLSQSTAQVGVWDTITKANLPIDTFTFSDEFFPYYGEITWSPDGKYLAYTTYITPTVSSTSMELSVTEKLWVWDASTNKKWPIDTYPFYYNYSVFANMSWSPGGKYLAFTTSSSTNPVQVWVWDASTKANLPPIYDYTYTDSGNQPPSAKITWSPDGRYLAYTTYTLSPNVGLSTVPKSKVHIGVWDASTKAPLSPIYDYTYTDSGNQYPSAKIIWSPGGKYLAFSTDANSVGAEQLWIWDASTNNKRFIDTNIYLCNDNPDSACITWSPDGKYLAFATDTQVRAWYLITHANLLIYTGDTFNVTITWSPDGKYLDFIAPDVLWVWDSFSKAMSNSFTYPNSNTNTSNNNTSASSDSPYPILTWSNDDNHLAFANYNIRQLCEITSNSSSCNGIEYIWDATTKDMIYILPLSRSAVDIAAWSPDNSRIASVSSDGTLYVWYAV